MFDYEITQKSHFTGKDGISSYEAWCKGMGINTGDFPFRVKTGTRSRRGAEITMNVQSWGFYQGSDWRYYVFISYRTSDNKMTCAYHWDIDSDGLPTGQPRKHMWSN